MSYQLPQEWLDWLYNVLSPVYTNVVATYQDVAVCVASFPGLKMRTRVYTGEDGTRELLLNLFGTLPASVSGQIYQIPVEIWVPKHYPILCPISYVTPTPDMVIQPGNFVDNNGRFYNPYLSYWSDKSNLLGLCAVMSESFGLEPPVYAVQRPAASTAPQAKVPESVKPAMPAMPAKPEKPEKPVPVASTSSQVPNLPPPLPPLPPLPPGKDDSRHAADTNVNTNVQSSTPVPPVPPAPPVIDLMDSEAASQGTDKSKEKLLKQLSEKLVAIFQSQVQPQMRELEARLGQYQMAIDGFEHTLNYEKNLLNTISNDVAVNDNLLNAKLIQEKELLKEAQAFVRPPLEEVIFAKTVVHNQLYNLVAEIRAIDDTIYSLQKLHDKGKIPLSLFVKQVRILAREQFMKKILVNKISEKI